MADISDIFNLIGEQKALSNIQDNYGSGSDFADSNPELAKIADTDPRTFQAMLPNIAQRQLQQSALKQYAQIMSKNSQPVQQGVPLDANSVLSQQLGNVGNSGIPDQAQDKTSQLLQLVPSLPQDIQQNVIKTAQGVPMNAGPPPAGQAYQNGKLVNVQGAMTPGQQDRDKDFADIYTAFKNTGGQQNAASQIQTIQSVIDGLTNGSIKTGRTSDRFAFDSEGDPSIVGRSIDPQLLVANSDVMRAVLPSAKAIFGPRVTQKEVALNVQSNGLNPYKDPQENIKTLTTLKNNLAAAQTAIAHAGQYFDQNGTLAGYQGPVPGIDAGATPLNPQGATTQPDPALKEALKKRGLFK